VKRDEGVIETAVRILRRRKLVVLAALIGVPILAFLFTASKEKEYEATATLLFREEPAVLGEAQSVVDPTREAETTAEIVALPVIAENAEKEFELPAGSVSGTVSVEASPTANTAAITSTSGDPQLSAEAANAYATAYIRFRRKQDRGQLQEPIELAEETIAELGPEEVGGEQELALKKQLDQLRLNQALQTGGAELVQKASPPSEASGPSKTKNVALGLVLGALLGFGLAALLERIDRRVRSSEEMEDLYGLPLIGRIPRSRMLSTTSSRSLGSQTQEGEAFRVLRANLRYFARDQARRTILIVSAEEGDGKSTISLGLATTMTEMGDSVVLVEADLRKGSSMKTVSGEPPKGLSDVLVDEDLDRVLLSVSVESPGDGADRLLTILPSGPTPPNPPELLEAPRMAETLAELRERFEFVIIDSPALGAVSDALALVPDVSEIVIVGGLGKTTRDAARDLMQQLAFLEREPVGVIVNFAEAERAKYSHYYRADLVGSGGSSRS
jgi:capsular exopolysaccharide synthesis family protein